MKELLFSEVIRARRKSLFLTQEQLCEGICEPVTMSRIENGKHNPSYGLMKALLQRLDLPDNRYTALLTDDEQELEDRKTEVNVRTLDFWDAAAADKPARREEALAALAALEAITEPEDNLTRQYAADYRVTLGRPEGPYSLEEKLTLLLSALRLTVPRFDPDNIAAFRYSEEEFTLVNQLAVAYAMAGDRKNAIHIYRQLFEYVQKHKQNLKRYAGNMGLIAFNYSRELNVDGSYSEAVKIAEQGRQVCVKYGRYDSLAGILGVLANCYAHLGRREESKEMYHHAYHFHKVLGHEAKIVHLKNDIRDTLGLELP